MVRCRACGQSLPRRKAVTDGVAPRFSWYHHDCAKDPKCAHCGKRVGSLANDLIQCPHGRHLVEPACAGPNRCPDAHVMAALGC